jgi:hypothetical protein
MSAIDEVREHLTQLRENNATSGRGSNRFVMKHMRGIARHAEALCSLAEAARAYREAHAAWKAARESEGRDGDAWGVFKARREGLFSVLARVEGASSP